MKNIKLLIRFMKGNKLIYLSATLSMAMAIIFSTAIPIFLKIIIDSIIGKAPISLPNWIVNPIQNAGGRELLLKNYGIFGVFVLLTLFNGFHVFSRAIERNNCRKFCKKTEIIV